MSLKISDTTRKVFHILGIVLLIALVGCIIRVTIWEHYYYKDKEGQPRNTIEAPMFESQQEVDEAEVTEEVKQEYTVLPDRPRYLSIEKLGISNARIREVSANQGEVMGVPASIFDVGWARNSGKPGFGGTLLMDGHNGGPTKDGVFKRLNSLVVGDIITVERGDGQLFYYEVHDTKILKLAEASAYMTEMTRSPISGRESISLITCTGEWIQAGRTYDSRVMLRAVLIVD